MKNKLAMAFAATLAMTGCTADTADEAVGEPSVGETAEGLTVSNNVATESPTSLRQSTGNLYWTYNAVRLRTSPYTARVYRTGKTSTIGQELMLYEESSPSGVSFGSLTYAEVDSQYYAYFVANYGSTSQIKRIPLAGGGAVTIATSPSYIGLRDSLDTDGGYLYWADDTGVRKMPIRGGAISTLASGISGAGPLRVSKYGEPFFAEGPVLWQASTTGTPPRVLAIAKDSITSISVSVEGYLGGWRDILWGDRSGQVANTEINTQTSAQPLSTTVLYVEPEGNFVSSVFHYYDLYDTAHANTAWIACTTPSSSSCILRVYQSAGAVITAASGAKLLQTDATGLYWGTTTNVKRAAF